MGEHEWLADCQNWTLAKLREEYEDLIDLADDARRGRRYAELASLLVDGEILGEVIDTRLGFINY